MSIKEVRLEMIGLREKSQIIRFHIEGKSNRWIAKTLHIDRGTVGKYVSEYDAIQNALISTSKDDSERVRTLAEKILAKPKYDSSTRTNKKLTPELSARLDEILAAEAKKDEVLGRHKQSLSRKQIFDLVKEEGFDVGYTSICKFVNAKLEKAKEAFIAQDYDFGERFEYDFGEAKLLIAGVLRKIQIAVMCCPASDYRFALLYESQDYNVFEDSQVKFFEHMGGCFKEGVYDNMKNVVSKFLGKSEKELNPRLIKLAAYYGFVLNVTNAYSGNEKGSVERSVDIVRNAAFAPKWEFGSVAEAQAHLDAVLAKLNEGKPVDKERTALSPYRPPYECADIRSGCNVDKYSCVTYDCASYSVPDTLVGKKVDVKAYPWDVVVFYRGKQIASHRRIYEKGGMRLDIHHYASTFRKKPGALRNSVVLRANKRLKGIFDTHYKANPREFINIVCANPGVGADELSDILLMHATATTNDASATCANAIERKTLDQINKIAFGMKEEAPCTLSA